MLDKLDFSNAGGLASIKHQLAKYLGKVDGAVGDTIAGLQDVVPAPTENGDKDIKDLLRGFRAAKGKADAAKAELAKADPSDPAAFQSTL